MANNLLVAADSRITCYTISFTFNFRFDAWHMS